jgi:ketosteroid isomerase-like protein
LKVINKSTTDPAEFPNVFKANFDANLLDVIVAGYAEDGVLDLGGGNAFRGREQIRLAISKFLAPRLPIGVTPRKALVTGDHAVVLFDWSIKGLAPDGSPVEMAGAAVDVLRREDDGVWRQILDLPFGHATPVV